PCSTARRRSAFSSIAATASAATARIFSSRDYTGLAPSPTPFEPNAEKRTRVSRNGAGSDVVRLEHEPNVPTLLATREDVATEKRFVTAADDPDVDVRRQPLVLRRHRRLEAEPAVLVRNDGRAACELVHAAGVRLPELDV